jgi:hypothetical protein
MSTFRLVLVPGLITLAVTLLRLVGELNGWSPRLFSAEAGGGGALVGITWLVPFFGIYFALKLYQSGALSGSWRPLGMSALGIAVFAAIGVSGTLLFGLDPNAPTIGSLVMNVVASIAALAVVYYGVPVLGKVLAAYGLVARIPVVLVMLVAILGNWGTHYDVAPPGVPEMGALTKWILIGVLPQLTFWLAFTLAVGGLFGGLALAIASRRAVAQSA